VKYYKYGHLKDISKDLNRLFDYIDSLNNKINTATNTVYNP
jgi:hypothetical protein